MVVPVTCKNEEDRINIMKTCPCNVHPLTPHFYIVYWGLQGYTFFLIFALKHRLWVLDRTAINALSKNKKTHHLFSYANCLFYSREKLQYITWACFRNEIKGA